MRPGDVLVITKLDRAGRSVKHLIDLAENLNSKGMGLKTLDQSIDTTSPMGKVMFTILAAFAEFERNINLERTMEGLNTAWSNGKKSGQPPKLTPEQANMVVMLYDAGQTPTQLGRSFNVDPATIYRVLKRRPTPVR
jgi:DNA invertase Pin-like site-specific DNA recombinase